MNSVALENCSPLILIIGAQKSGTTALFNYLNKHPNILGAKEKEVNFFNSQARFDLGVSFYKSQFPDGPANSLRLDASPSYFVNHDALRRISETDRNVKMVLLLRDPVDRAYSAWQMYRKRYHIDRKWFFDDWLKQMGKNFSDYISRKDGEINDFYSYIKAEIEALKYFPLSPIEAPVIKHGLYASHLERCFEYFSREQFFIEESGAFRSSAVDTLQRVELFLGLDTIDWNNQDLSPVFEGGYSERISNDALRLLSDFYGPHNEKLYQMLGSRFLWK